MNKSSDFDLAQILSVAEINLSKAMGMSDVLDADAFTMKWDALKYGLDRGLFKRNEWIETYKKWKADGFQLTDKGYDILRKSKEYQTDKIMQKKISKWREEWMAHYYQDDFVKISNDIDNGKYAWGRELQEIYKEHITRQDMAKIEEGILSTKAGIPKAKEQVIEDIMAINQRSKLNLDWYINKALKGKDKDFDNLIKKYSGLKANGFISDEAFQSAKKTVNVKADIGFTKRAVNSLKEAAEKLWDTKVSKKDVEKKVKENPQYKAASDKMMKTIDELADAVKNKMYKKADALRSVLKSEKRNQRQIRYNILAENNQISMLKREVTKDLRMKASVMGIDRKVIDKMESRAYWQDAKTATDFIKSVDKMASALENAYTKSLFDNIRKEFKSLSVIKWLNFTKSSTMDIQYIVELKKIEKVFSDKVKGDINIVDLEKILVEVRDLKAEAKTSYKKVEAQKKLEIANLQWSINQTLLKVGIKEDAETFLEKAKEMVDTLENTSLVQYRLIEKIFNDNPEAYKVFITNIQTANNRFEAWEKLAKNLANTIVKVLGDDNVKMAQFWDLLLARNVDYLDDWVQFTGIARQVYDKSKKSGFNTKLPESEYLKMEDKPKWLSALPNISDTDKISWDEIRKTELGRTFMKEGDKNYQKLFKIWDKFYTLEGSALKRVAKEVDNIDVNIHEKYSPMQRKNRNDADLDFEIGDVMTGANGHINKWSLKNRATIDQIKNLGSTYENNPIKLILGQSRTTRYYIHMQESLQKASRVYNGYWGKLSNLSPEELAEIKKNNPNVQFSYANRVGELDMNDIDIDGNMSFSYITEGLKDRVVERVSPESVDVINPNNAVKNNLSKEHQKRMKLFLEWVANGGSKNLSEWERALTKLANHFNALPMLFNISSAIKQPLALIDAIPFVWSRNLMSAAQNIARDSRLNKALDKVSAISARTDAWPNYNIREVNNRNMAHKWDTGKIKKAYGAYQEAGFFMLTRMDSMSYKAIWAAAYKKQLLDSGKLKKWEPLTAKHIETWDEAMVEMMAKSDIMANKAASTADPLFQQQMYRSAYIKMFAGLMTAQMNRMQNLYKMWPSLYKDGQYTELWVLVASNLVGAYLDYQIGMQIGKALHWMWFEQWDGYAEDQEDLLFNREVAIRLSAWQTLLWGKAIEMITGGSLSPMLWGIGKFGESFAPIYEGISTWDWDVEMSMVVDIATTWVLGKLGKYASSQLKEQWVID